MKARRRIVRAALFVPRGLKPYLHHTLHALFGVVFYFYFVEPYFPGNFQQLFLLAILGSLLPDADHILYFLVYGRKKEYTQMAKAVFREDGIRAFFRFCNTNHKLQTGLVSHNLLTVATLFLFTIIFFVDAQAKSFTLAGAMSVHFLMDMVEDWIYLGGLNPNWYLKFGREPKPRKNRKQQAINKLKEKLI